MTASICTAALAILPCIRALLTNAIDTASGCLASNLAARLEVLVPSPPGLPGVHVYLTPGAEVCLSVSDTLRQRPSACSTTAPCGVPLECIHCAEIKITLHLCRLRREKRHYVLYA